MNSHKGNEQCIAKQQQQLFSKRKLIGPRDTVVDTSTGKIKLEPADESTEIKPQMITAEGDEGVDQVILVNTSAVVNQDDQEVKVVIVNEEVDIPADNEHSVPIAGTSSAKRQKCTGKAKEKCVNQGRQLMAEPHFDEQEGHSGKQLPQTMESVSNTDQQVLQPSHPVEVDVPDYGRFTIRRNPKPARYLPYTSAAKRRRKR